MKKMMITNTIINSVTQEHCDHTATLRETHSLQKKSKGFRYNTVKGKKQFQLHFNNVTTFRTKLSSYALMKGIKIYIL